MVIVEILTTHPTSHTYTLLPQADVTVHSLIFPFFLYHDTRGSASTHCVPILFTGLTQIDLPKIAPMPVGAWNSVHLVSPAGASVLAINLPTLRCPSSRPFSSFASYWNLWRGRRWRSSTGFSQSPKKRSTFTSGPGRPSERRNQSISLVH